MSCPHCGGNQRRLIAPGLYECTSTVEVMGYMPAPGPSQGPVPLIPGPELRVCGNRYQEGSVTAPLGLCSCGMSAVAECVDCRKVLCGDHIASRNGRVLCKDDRLAFDRERVTRELSTFLEKLRHVVEGRDDPTERALLIHLAKKNAPQSAFAPSWGINSRGGSVESTAEDLRARHRGMLIETFHSLLPDAGPAFTFLSSSDWVELKSGRAFAAWAFSHRHAASVTKLPIIKEYQYIEWLKIPRGHLKALRVASEHHEAATGDQQRGRYYPPAYLLESGVILRASTLTPRQSTSEQKLPSTEHYGDVARTLGFGTPHGYFE